MVRGAGGAIAEVLVKARGDVRWDGASSLKFSGLTVGLEPTSIICISVYGLSPTAGLHDGADFRT